METVTFVDGMYTYSDLNDYIHQYMNKKGHKTSDRTGEKYNINLSFILSTYRILIQIDNNYQLDLKNSKFGELIGFSEKIVDKTETGDDLPNITNSIGMIYINTDAIINNDLNIAICTSIISKLIIFMKQSEFKRRYEVKMGRYVKKHICGDGVTDVFKTIGRTFFGKTVKEAANTAIKKGFSDCCY